MSFFLYPGNKLETLAGICCQLIGNDPGSDPMAQETIVVQTQGMAAYLPQFFARRNGIAANIQMPFPAGFIAGILKQNIPEFEIASRYFSQEQLVWEIFSIFQEDKADFPELAGYIANTSDAVFRCWQLARRTATLFDRYQIYRYKDEYFPLKNDEWQSRLWKKLLQKYGKSKMQCCREFLALDRPLKGLPRRLTIFGVGSLPPLYLDIFFKIAQEIDLRFFYMTPCKDFWEHLYSVKEQRWLCKGDEMPEAGNPLLASWGSSGRELFANLLAQQDVSPYVSSEEQLFEDYLPDDTSPTVLQRLQQDIFTMRDGRTEPCKAAPDGSVEIINCHAPRREVEVLHDKLLTVFNEDEADPGDVIVMAPDINSYLPYIESVFGRGPLKYCYTVSDRNLRSNGGAGNVFRRLLELPGCRMDVDDVMGILNNSFICKRRKIVPSELPVIYNWLQETGVRWGMDAADHERHCAAAFEEYSWRSGMDRMFENFARGLTPDEELAGFPELLDESGLELFGKFNSFLRELSELRQKFSVPHTLAEWMDMLLDALNRFFDTSDKDIASEITLLRRFLNEQKSMIRDLNMKSLLPVAVIAEMLDGFLNAAHDRFSFLRGKITFCSLTPLRSVPAKVIAVLGLDEGAFPRRDVELGFDLMTAKLLPGDRSGAKEDRYLFLEALMSARKNFWCFYNGRSRRTGKELETSVVLGELQEYLEQVFGLKEQKQYLHGFDLRYFSCDGEFSSWSQENFHVARLLNGERIEPESRSSELDRAAAAEIRHFDLNDLISWASHPAEYVFKRNLNVRFPVPEDISIAEPILHGGGLEKLKTRKMLSIFDKKDRAGDELYMLMKKHNMLPPGDAGAAEFKNELTLLRKIEPEWRREFYAQERMALSFDVDLPDDKKITISGMFECSPALDMQKIIVFSTLKHKYYVGALMRHLALCAVSDAPDVETSLYYFKGNAWHEKVWHRMETDFWQEFILLRNEFSMRIPAVFPKTMFDFGTAGSDKRQTIKNNLTAECSSERRLSRRPEYSAEAVNDPALERYFSPDAMDDVVLREEFFRFAKLFYGVE